MYEESLFPEQTTDTTLTPGRFSLYYHKEIVTQHSLNTTAQTAADFLAQAGYRDLVTALPVITARRGGWLHNMYGITPKAAPTQLALRLRHTTAGVHVSVEMVVRYLPLTAINHADYRFWSGELHDLATSLETGEIMLKNSIAWMQDSIAQTRRMILYIMLFAFLGSGGFWVILHLLAR